MARLRDQLLSTYAAEAINLLSGLTFGIISARALGPEGRGVVAAIWAAITIGMMVSSFGIAKSLISRLNDREIDLTGSDFYGGLIVLLPVLALVSWAIIIPLAPPSLVGDAWILAIVVLIVPVMLVTDFARSVLRARRRIYLLNGIVAVSAIARVVVIVTLWHFDEVNVATVLMIEAGFWTFTGAIACAALWRSILRVPRFSSMGGAIRSLLSYGLMFQAYSLLFNMINKISVPALSALSGSEVTGHFAVSLRMAEYLGTFTNQIIFVFVPLLAQKEEKIAAFEYAIKLTRISVIFLVPAGALLSISADWLIPLLYGEAFAPAIAPFRVMVAAIVAATLFQFTGMAAVATGDLKAVTICAGIGLAVNAVLMILLIPRHGALGAGISAAFGHSVALGTHVIALKVRCHVAIADVLVPSPRDLRSARRRFNA